MLTIEQLNNERARLLTQLDAIDSLIATMGGEAGNGVTVKPSGRKHKATAKPTGKRTMSVAAKKKLAKAAKLRWAKAKAAGKTTL